MFLDKGINTGEWEVIALSLLHILMSLLGSENILLQGHFSSTYPANSRENSSLVKVQDIEGSSLSPEVVS